MQVSENIRSFYIILVKEKKKKTKMIEHICSCYLAQLYRLDSTDFINVPYIKFLFFFLSSDMF